jgi:pilus assembly protein CpaC
MPHPSALVFRTAAALLLCHAATQPLAGPRQQPAAALSFGPEGQVTQVPQLPQGTGGASVSVAASRGGIAVEAGSGRIVTLGAAATSVFTADPKIVDVRPASPTTLFLFGVAPGKSTVAAMDANGHLVAQWEVMVHPSSYGALEASAAISRIMPGRGVQVDERVDGLVVHGTVASGAEAERVMATARGYAAAKQTVENRLHVTGPAQVTLRVRVAEMSRSLTRELGVNWQKLGQVGRFAVGFSLINPLANSVLTASQLSFGTQRPGDVNGVIDALSQDQLIHLLAEPTLTAMSGETASFLAGGEFPIPVGSNGPVGDRTITVDFKQYGVSLAFVPTVLSDGQINLRVRPEVSQLTTDGAVSIGGIQIPALKVRRAETTVELGSGQSFAIAGLLSDTATVTGNGLPFLGDLPVIGALFRSDGFQRQETELVIVVTPYLAGPVSDPRAISAPTDNWRPPNDAERILLLRQTGSTAVPSPAGFVVR